MKRMFLALQLALMAWGLGLGGGSTPEGGTLLLLSLFCSGAFFGWAFRERG